MQPSRATPIRRTVQAALLLFAVGVTLRVVDCGPRAAWRQGDVRELPDIAAVEQASGQRLALPSWYPSTLPWPPARVIAVGAGPDAVALVLGGADAGAPELVLAQTLRGPMELPAAFFPPALELESRPLDLPPGPARLTRLRGPDGAPWHELSWAQDGQAFVFRSRGSLEQLFDLATSVRREGK
jgi:hypothetical protein